MEKKLECFTTITYVQHDSSFLIKIRSPYNAQKSTRLDISSTDQTGIRGTITLPKCCKQRVSFPIYTGKIVHDHNWIRKLFCLLNHSWIKTALFVALIPRDMISACAAFLTGIRYNAGLFIQGLWFLIMCYWVHQHRTAKIPRNLIGSLTDK